LAPVTVAPSRAEVPDASTLARGLSRIGEQLMLNGYRRVLVIGGRSAWQRVLRESIDSRIELRFLPGRNRTERDAEADVQRTDVVILWGVEADASAQRVYQTGRAQVISVPTGSFADFLRCVLSSLVED
jgi:precorrin-6x reductase